MGGVNLIRQRAKPLTRRLTSDEFAHTPTLSNTHAKHDTRNPHSTRNLWTKTDLGTTRPPTQNCRCQMLGAYAAHGMIAASDVPTPAGLLTRR